MLTLADVEGIASAPGISSCGVRFDQSAHISDCLGSQNVIVGPSSSSAVVSHEGCTFFWSEQVRGST